jgi:hypothetical protein
VNERKGVICRIVKRHAMTTRQLQRFRKPGIGWGASSMPNFINADSQIAACAGKRRETVLPTSQSQSAGGRNLKVGLGPGARSGPRGGQLRASAVDLFPPFGFDREHITLPSRSHSTTENPHLLRARTPNASSFNRRAARITPIRPSRRSWPSCVSWPPVRERMGV